MFLWLKTLYRKRAVTWPFIFYTIIWTLSYVFLLKIIDISNIITLIYLISHFYFIKKLILRKLNNFSQNQFFFDK
ncbi:hypothetical protein CUS22_09045 [Enterococcus faecium]|nr:hypothetical protein CUS22_09045 [Enterococcus faecium]